MTLYDIDARIAACFDEETGEVLDCEALDALAMEREIKVGHIARAYRNLSAEADAIDAEIKRLRDKLASANRRANNCKAYLEHALGGEKFKDGVVTVSYRKSVAVVVEEGAQIPDEYLRHPAPEINRTALGAALKAGVAIQGARLEDRMNIQVR